MSKKEEVPAYTAQELTELMNNYDTVRLCPKLGLHTTIELHQNKKLAESLIKQYSEEAEVIDDKCKDKDGKRLKDQYEKEITELNKKRYPASFKLVKKSKFPSEREEFGYKDIERPTQIGTVTKNRVHFVDSFVELYTAGLIIDDTTVVEGDEASK